MLFCLLCTFKKTILIMSILPTMRTSILRIQSNLKFLSVKDSGEIPERGIPPESNVSIR